VIFSMPIWPVPFVRTRTSNAVREQDEQVEKLFRQLENAYQKVQDIALKAIEGPSIPKTSPGFQSPRGDQGVGQSKEG